MGIVVFKYGYDVVVKFRDGRRVESRIFCNGLKLGETITPMDFNLKDVEENDRLTADQQFVITLVGGTRWCLQEI